MDIAIIHEANQTTIKMHPEARSNSASIKKPKNPNPWMKCMLASNKKERKTERKKERKTCPPLPKHQSYQKPWNMSMFSKALAQALLAFASYICHCKSRPGTDLECLAGLRPRKYDQRSARTFGKRWAESTEHLCEMGTQKRFIRERHLWFFCEPASDGSRHCNIGMQHSHSLPFVCR